MSSLLTTELEARVRMAEREREIRRIERWSWQEQPPKRGVQLPVRMHAVRHCVGALVVRLGVWIAGGEDAHSRDSREGPHQRHDNRNLRPPFWGAP